MNETRIQKIPPPVLALALAIIMWALKTWIPILTVAAGPLHWIGPLLSGIGLSIIIVSFRTFKRHGTTIDPVNPNRASMLVTSGIFSLSRNPMYVGLTLILLGWNVWLGALSSLLCIVVFIFYISVFQIGREELVLKQKFGSSYLDYQQRVRRWL